MAKTPKTSKLPAAGDTIALSPAAEVPASRQRADEAYAAAFAEFSAALAAGQSVDEAQPPFLARLKQIGDAHQADVAAEAAATLRAGQAAQEERRETGTTVVASGGSVRITSRREGWRRAGMAHSITPVDHPAGTFTAEQIETLLADPNLIVELV